jgi:cytochrome P450
MTWGLLELAKHPEIQSRLRAEIRETEAAIHARGEVDFTMADFDAMPYTTAVMKVRDIAQNTMVYRDARCYCRRF